MTLKTHARRKMDIAFIHPDLGIGCLTPRSAKLIVGGAERLVIDAAVGLQARGHRVTIYTSHCDKTHCFDEARDGKSSSIASLRVRITLSLCILVSETLKTNSRNTERKSPRQYNNPNPHSRPLFHPLRHPPSTPPLYPPPNQSISPARNSHNRPTLNLNPAPSNPIPHPILLPFSR